MATKTCTKCKVEKPFKEYNNQKSAKYGLNPVCKICKKKSDQEYRKTNKDKISKSRKIYWENNKEELIKKRSVYYKKNKEKINEQTKSYRLNNPEKMKEIAENYKEKQSLLRKIRYQKNKEEENKKSKEYYNAKKDTEHYRKTKQKYRKERKKDDPLFNLRIKIANRVYVAFKQQKYSKNTLTEKMIGCSWEKLKEHIQKQFIDDMSWDNYGEWQVDHIIPLSSSLNREEMIKLCHYTNLQPLSKEENLEKKNKYNEEDKIKFLKSLEK